MHYPDWGKCALFQELRKVSRPYDSWSAENGRLSPVNETLVTAATPLRVSDLVPLRRMLGTDSIVMRVNPDGSFVPVAQMPALFFERALRDVLTDDVDGRFERACVAAIELSTSVVFRPDMSYADELVINPILADRGPECRFLVCWARATVKNATSGSISWGALRLDDVVTRYRVRFDQRSAVIEATPWWALTSGELLALWSHHSHVSAMGLGHAVMESLVINAAEAAAEFGGGPAVRIEVPSGDMLAGLVPVFHGAVRASGLAPERVIVALDVGLAVDPDLLPIIVHLRAMGMRIDIVGLDALTTTLHTVSDTSSHLSSMTVPTVTEYGPWVADFGQAQTSKAA